MPSCQPVVMETGLAQRKLGRSKDGRVDAAAQQIKIPFRSRLRLARGGGSAWTPSVRPAHQVQGARPSRRVGSCMARALMSWSWRQRKTDSRGGRRRRGGAPAVARTGTGGTATDDRGRAQPVPSLEIPCLQPTLHAAAASRARARSGAAPSSGSLPVN